MDSSLIAFLCLSETAKHVLSLGRVCAILKTSPHDVVTRMGTLGIKAAIVIDDRAYFHAEDVKSVAQQMDAEEAAQTAKPKCKHAEAN